jgi:hypothetical protein
VTHFLDDPNWWTDNQNNRHAISDMPGDYAQNIFNLLVRKAEQLASSYTLYLASVTPPVEGSYAADRYEREVDGEIALMGDNVYEWLTNKPLMQALRWRIDAQPLSTHCWCGHAKTDHIQPNDDPRALCVGCTRRPIGTSKVPNRAFHTTADIRPSDDELEANATGVRFDDAFRKRKADARAKEAARIREQAKTDYDLPANRLLDNPVPEYEDVEPEDGDENRVFIVTTGCYSDFSIDSAFYADRNAAFRRAFFLTLRGESYAEVRVEADQGRNSMVVMPGVKEDPEVIVANYRTRISIDSGKIFDQQAQTKMVRMSYVEPTRTVVEQRTPQTVTARGWRHEVEVSTTGPVTDIERIKKSHAERVAFVRAALIEGSPFV